MRAIIGLDPSLRGFGMCVIDAEGKVYLSEWATEPQTTVRGRVKRFRRMAAPAVEAVKRYAPELVLIEGYAFSSKGQGILDRSECRGILLDRLEGYPDAIVEVPPTTIKKFVLGQGRSTKDSPISKTTVVSALVKRYGQEFQTDNQADAFALAVMGQIVAGYRQPETAFQAEAIAVVTTLLQQELEQ